MYFDQSRFDIRLEWGAQGVESLASELDASAVAPLLAGDAFTDAA